MCINVINIQLSNLRDGKKLLQLLEIFSGKKLGKAKSGRMRFIWLDNVNRALAFLRTKVYLENVAAEDIVNGNPSLTLGLVWTIILSHTIIQDETESHSESAFCQKCPFSSAKKWHFERPHLRTDSKNPAKHPPKWWGRHLVRK